MSRIYLGQVQLRDEWFPGQYEPLITQAEFDAAHRGFVPGRTRRSREALSGRVRCALCRRMAGVEYTQNGKRVFRCKHRGKGWAMPRRRAAMLERAVLLGMHLLRTDESLRGPGVLLADLERQRRKLLELYYADKIGADLFGEEEKRLRTAIADANAQETEAAEQVHEADELARRFEEVAAVLESLEPERVWQAATQDERRVLVEELVEEVALFPDHLEVVINGAPRLNVLFDEVAVQSVGVRGGT